MKEWILRFTRRLVGLNQVNARFDELEERLAQLAADLRVPANVPVGDISVVGSQHQAKAGEPEPLSELRRVILNGGSPRPYSPLVNENPSFREIYTCRALAPEAIFIFGFARSGTTITLELLNYSSNDCFLLGEANFFLPKGKMSFPEWYEKHVEAQGNQASKSFHPLGIIDGRSYTWWEYMLAISEFYPRVGDKVALSALHFKHRSGEQIRRFFESRFLSSSYVFLIRDPTRALRSWKSLRAIDQDEQLRQEALAWLKHIMLWADMVRVFPKTCTLITDDFGPASLDRLQQFLGFPMMQQLFQSAAQRKWEEEDGAKTLLDVEKSLRAVFDMVRAASHTQQALWHFDRKEVLRSDPDLSSVEKSLLDLPGTGPIGAIWKTAKALHDELSAASRD